MRLFSIISFVILISTFTFAQEGQVQNFVADARVSCHAVEGNYLWLGTTNYLSRFNILTKEKEIFLINYNIYSIVIDQQGNKWVTHNKGVSKYNGLEWVHYNTSNSGLPENSISAVAIDKEGNKWFTSFDSGLVKYDDKSWTIYHPWPGTKRAFRELVIDNQDNKWVKVIDFSPFNPKGLAKFDGESWTLYDTTNSALKNNFIGTITLDELGNLWVGAADGIVKYDGKSWSLYQHDFFKSFDDFHNYVYAIQGDKQGNMWFGTFSGLIKFDGSNWDYKTYLTVPGFTDKDIHDIMIDSLGGMWTDSEGGFVKFDTQGCIRYLTSNSPMKFGGVRSIAVDPMQNKWFALPEGVYKYDGKSWTLYDTLASVIPSIFVNEIKVDPAGNLWFRAVSGIVKFDYKTWKLYKASDFGSAVRGFTAMAFDNQGNKWFGTDTSGVIKYNDSTWTVFNKSNSGLPGNYISLIGIDQEGGKWFYTEQKLANYDDQNWKIYDVNHGLPSFNLFAMAFEKGGICWFGTGEGLSKFDGQTWDLYNILNSGLPHKVVRTISIDMQGNKWIGTEQGFVKFDGQNWKVYNISNSRLLDNKIYNIAFDSSGGKWVGTFKGGILTFKDEEDIVGNIKEHKISSPEKFSLSQNYPNPFNPSTKISFAIPEGRIVKLTVYDILGKEVSTLVNEYKPAGSHTVLFKAPQLPSGVYIYTIRAGEFTSSKKLLLIK